LARVGQQLAEANAALRKATEWLGAHLQSNPDAALAGATPYLRLFGIAAGGSYLGRGALLAARGGAASDAGARQLALAKFFAETFAPSASGLARNVMEGAAALPASDAAVFNV